MARKVIMVLCVVVTCMMVVAPYAEAVLNCTQVIANLTPCVTFLTNGGGSIVAPPCCTGIAALNASATTTADRQAACNCVINYLISGPGSNLTINAAASLPGRCGVSIPFRISATTTCSNVR
ncbi:hypothetical protein M8C21_011306 [Ambrosia artemisiifolia]|uniref:Non-specific lipid-transfer protein n=1 Tax=Ambrosia artemisiifolia TaxID=4212 RepID=A0AAD5GI14_AMBAR|nr:hypothetical protein M8C21_011306 [Ambrosia artemisiifolia]